jgi:hypothetical protein
MSEALDLIYDTLDVFSGKKKSLKEPGLVDLLDTAHAKERRAANPEMYIDCPRPGETHVD